MCAPVLRRFVDVVGIDKETKEVVELRQVGVGTKKSGAIKRESGIRRHPQFCRL